MAQIVLASGSPRRHELLQRMGITDFDVRIPEANESYSPQLSPAEIVMQISRQKSDAARSLCSAEEILITADTMVFLDSQRLGKPRDTEEALQMLLSLQGRKHTVCTGVTVRQGARSITECESTDVYFRPASKQELNAYIRAGEPMDKAGAYGVQGLGGLFVEKIDGDFYNVMGLPILRLSQMLGQFGIHFFE